MIVPQLPLEKFPIAASREILRSVAIAAVVGALAGTAGAGFITALDAVTETRFEHRWLLVLLPLAGLLTTWIYRRVGGRSERGNNLIMEEIHEPGGGVPLRMAPLVLGATLLTHLCGGSAGREGTAVQMGGALAGGVQRILRLGKDAQAMILSCGVAGGFGAVFGTPLAGAVFALEVLVRGRMAYTWFGPCMVAALTGDLVCHAWGAAHENLATAVAALDAIPDGLNPSVIGRALVLGVICGLCAKLFTATSHGIAHFCREKLPRWWLAPVVGGLTLGALTLLIGTDAYLGLGATHPDPAQPSLATMFTAGGATPWSWLWKLVFTAVTVGAGFKGGEVTPLFFIGAALGHVIGPLLGLPLTLGVALGFVGVFAGASKTPLACTLLAIELFGGAHVELFALVCLVSYLSSGPGGIYAAQRET